MVLYWEPRIILGIVQQIYWLSFYYTPDKQEQYYKYSYLVERVHSFHIQGGYDLLLLFGWHSHYFVLYRTSVSSNNSNLIAFYRVFAICIDWLTYYFVIDSTFFSNFSLIRKICLRLSAYVISLRNSFAFTSAICRYCGLFIIVVVNLLYFLLLSEYFLIRIFSTRVYI